MTTRRSIGWPLPIVTLIFLAYSYFGYLIPGSFGHRGYDLHRILNQMFMTTEGIFGIPLGVVVTIVFLFILFGAFLEKGGGGKFFIDLAVAMAGRLRGGPAKIAVVSSGLMGMISGSSIANVVTTGTFTIPMMKRIGYRPEFAGAVEACASTGGQIMPPVMGAAAFIMSEFTHTPYVNHHRDGGHPGAVLYYLSIYMNVHFEACRTGMKGLPEIGNPQGDQRPEGWLALHPAGHRPGGRSCHGLQPRTVRLRRDGDPDRHQHDQGLHADGCEGFLGGFELGGARAPSGSRRRAPAPASLSASRA